MKEKSETAVLIKSFVTLAGTQFNAKIKAIRSDNELEFRLPKFYVSNGMLRGNTNIYWELQDPSRSNQIYKNHFWKYEISYLIHIINRLPKNFLLN